MVSPRATTKKKKETQKYEKKSLKELKYARKYSLNANKSRKGKKKEEKSCNTYRLQK